MVFPQFCKKKFSALLFSWWLLLFPSWLEFFIYRVFFSLPFLIIPYYAGGKVLNANGEEGGGRMLCLPQQALQGWGPPVRDLSQPPRKIR